MPTASGNQILVITPEEALNQRFADALFADGTQIICHTELSGAKVDLDLITPALVVVGEKFKDVDGLDFAAYILRRYPGVPVLLCAADLTADLLHRALRAGMTDVVANSSGAEALQQAAQFCLQSARQRREQLSAEYQRGSSASTQQLTEMDQLARLGRSIIGSLEIDTVLTAVVDAAVQLTGAEEGSLLLLDEATGELYVRAARNFNEDFVHTFRLPVQDTLAGSVLRTGKPVLLDEKTPQKIKTSYLVHSLLYVPLQINGRVFGVLGVDNRRQRLALGEHHVQILSAMADYAVIALENARLFASVSSERAKLETILTRTQDGVVVMDSSHRLILVNPAAQAAFHLEGDSFEGKEYPAVFPQPEMQELVDTASKDETNRMEVSLSDGRVFIALLTPIPEVGAAITLHDVTYLKKLDRIKSEFVSTVSHDLRSPLTAILGYVELIERAGAVTDLQKQFIRRVQASVNNITNLVDDLVNLGRIESGFDTRKENLQIERIIRYAMDGYKKQLAERSHAITLEVPEVLPPVFGNSVQLRQVIDHLLENANQYTLPGGTIAIHAEVDGKQVIIQVCDTGIGIPAIDLPFIFDKFYRASNAAAETSGTGLGLAIVKSVIESHQGRIWVDSTVGKGSTFTIVLPLAD